MVKLIKEVLEFLRYLNYGIESKNPYRKSYTLGEKNQSYKFAK